MSHQLKRVVQEATLLKSTLIQNNIITQKETEEYNKMNTINDNELEDLNDQQSNMNMNKINTINDNELEDLNDQQSNMNKNVLENNNQIKDNQPDTDKILKTDDNVLEDKD
jgi:hypothetical protein